jgi:hypothetical protein
MKSAAFGHKLAGLLFPWHSALEIEALAGEIARHCKAGLIRQIGQGAKEIPLSQMKGYLRAFSRDCCQTALQKVAAEQQIARSLYNRILNRSEELLIDAVCRDLCTSAASAPATANIRLPVAA